MGSTFSRLNHSEIFQRLNDGLNNLKKLCFDEEKEQYYLYSCNKNQKKYAPIYVDELRVQGVAVCTVHNIGNLL